MKNSYLKLLALLAFLGFINTSQSRLHAQSLPGDSLAYGPNFSVIYGDSINVWVLTKNSTGSGLTLSLEITDSAGNVLSGTQISGDTRINLNTRKYLYTGILPGHLYRARVKDANGNIIRESTLQQNPNTLTDFNFLAGGCGRIMDMTRCVDQIEGPKHTNGTTNIYKHMAIENADLMVWLGDAVYLFGIEHSDGQCSGMVNDWDNMNALYSRYYFDRQFYDTLTRKMPQLAITDNHDVGGNEFNKTMATLDTSELNFRQWWQNPQWKSSPPRQGLYSTYKYKDIEFFLTDNRSYRDGIAYQWGPEQLVYMENALLNSTATYKVLISGTPMFANINGRNFSNTTQSDTLFNFVRQHHINGIIAYSADIHNQEFTTVNTGNPYPFIDVLSGNLASDIGNTATTTPDNDMTYYSNHQTYMKNYVYGDEGNRRLKIEYTTPEGIVDYRAIVHEDMLKSIDDSTIKIKLNFSQNDLDSSKYHHFTEGTSLTMVADNHSNANSAASFNGTDSLTMNFAPELETHDRSFSLAYWAKPATNNNATATIFSNKNANAGFATGINQNNNPVFTNYVNGANYVASNIKLSPEKWNHIIWEYDNIHLQLKLLYNGQLAKKWSGVSNIQPSSAKIIIGNDVDKNGYQGALDGLVLYGKLIQDSTVQALSEYKSTRGGALSLKGNESLYIPKDSLANVLNNNFTIEFWTRFKSDPVIGAKLLSSNGRTNNNTQGLSIEFLDNNKLTVAAGNNTSNWTKIDSASGNPLQLNEWNHVALSVTKNDSMRLYVNGVYVGKGAFSSYYNTFNMGIGMSANYSNTPFTGEMDELRFWRKALTQQEIINHQYIPLTNSDTANLVMYFNFDSAQNNTFSSIYGKKPSITLTGAAITSSTAPLAVIPVNYQQKVLGDWSFRMDTTAAISLQDAITNTESNVIVGHNIDSTLSNWAGADHYFYVKGGWVFNNLNTPIVNLNCKPKMAIANYDSLKSIVSDYALLRVSNGDTTNVSTGYFDGNKLKFTDFYIDSGIYYLAIKIDSNDHLFDRGAALSMPGGHAISIGNTIANNALSGSFTIEFWSRNMQTNTTNNKVLSNNSNVNNTKNGLSIEYTLDGSSMNAAIGAGSGWNTLSYSNTIQLAEWNHFALTVVPNGQANFYVNGQKVDSEAFTSYYPSTYNLALGKSLNYGGESIGTIDELRIWKIAKTPTQIKEQMHLSLPQGFDTNLVINYTFNNYSITKLYNSGTLNDSISYTNATLIPTTAPVAIIPAVQQAHVTGTWSVRDSSNSGLNILVSVPDYETNLILGRDSLSGNDSLTQIPNGVKMRRLWEIDPIKITNGNMIFSGPQLFNSNWDEINATALEYYLIEKDTQTNQFVVKATGTVNNDSTIEFNQVNITPGLFTLAWKTNNGIALPLNWGYIKATAMSHFENKVLWQTIQEKNTYQFAIERSYDGKYFEQIANVNASGTTLNPTDYEYLDNNFAHDKKVIYYRIKEIDLDRNETFSPIVFVSQDNQQNKAGLVVSPNYGASKEMDVSISSTDDQKAVLTISNAAGQVIWKQNAVLNNTHQQLFPKLASGSYILVAIIDGQISETKFVVY